MSNDPVDFSGIHESAEPKNWVTTCLEYVSGSQVTMAEPTLSSLEQEISCLDTVMDHLNRVRIHKLQLRNQHIPIYSLPPEILQEIFIACLDDHTEDALPRPANGRGCPIPLLLAQICSLWRTLALRLPQLWDTINCVVPHPNQSARIAGLISDWIMRSKGRPLTIRLVFKHDALWTTSSPTDIIDALVQSSECWKHISMTVPSSWHAALSTVIDRLPRLERLFICPPTPTIESRFLDAFSIAPNLRTVSFDRYYLTGLHFPWTNLTKATIHQPSIDEAFELISRCPALTDLIVMDSSEPEGIFPWPAGELEHDRLEALTIMLRHHDDRTQPNSLHDFLGFLILPALQRLAVVLLPDSGEDMLFEIRLFIAKSGCPLGLVEVFGPTIPEEELTDFMCNVDSVKRFNNNSADPPFSTSEFYAPL